MKRGGLYQVALTATLTLALLAASVTVGCGGREPGATLRIDDRSIVLDSDRPLRAIRIDLEWDASLAVTDVVVGEHAERSNLVRARIDGTTARFLVADSRSIPLPLRGEIARVIATGDGAIRIVDVEAAESGARLVAVEVAP